ncbi:MAG: cytochrome c [Anaerolineae bacterium]|nr:MAG: cytochrome c [Anaerolineae bacterium]
MKKHLVFFALLLIFTLVLSACSSGGGKVAEEGEMEEVPAQYAGKTNPLGPDAAAQGQEVYTTYCASCHGDTGLGDGPAAASLDPAPANLQELAATADDDFLFWRISEGVSGTAMVPWKGTLSEEQIWQVISFLHTLK